MTSLYIEEDNLSLAWTKVLAKTFETGIDELHPLVVTVTGFDNGGVRTTPATTDLLDRYLKGIDKATSETVASTIFPISLWNPKAGREQLYRRYERVWPSIKKVHSNAHGVYFRRLTSFGTEGMNQLEFIIETWKRGNHRRSALQASVFDPKHDHHHARQRGFPCLQHVTFAPQGEDGLAVTGFYATQYIVERAYGNYLGLCRLGDFMARALGLRLVRMTCFTSIAIRDKSRTKLESLRKALSRLT